MLRNGGRDRDRTCDPYDVNVVVNHLPLFSHASPTQILADFSLDLLRFPLYLYFLKADEVYSDLLPRASPMLPRDKRGRTCRSSPNVL